MYLHPLIEFCARSILFGLNIPTLINRKKAKPTVNSKLNIQQIEAQMKKFNISKGDTVLIHSSFKHFSNSAEEFIEFLKEYIGPEGNILMPTHPKLNNVNGNLVYDKETSPSTVGYLTEVFRRSKDVYRSDYPFSSIAVWGKDVEYLLEHNLNDNLPLPHGIYSPYYKMTKLNGKVLCIGISAKRRGTIRHTAEEVLDNEYLVKDLFNTHEIYVKKEKEYKKVKVRALNLSKSQIFIAKSKLEKEWLDNGILTKNVIDGVPIEFIDAKKCVEYMIKEAKNGNTCYPYAPKRKRAK